MKKAYKQRVQFGSAALDHLNQILQLHHRRTQHTPTFHHKSKSHLILGQVETLEETTIETKIKKNIRNQKLAWVTIPFQNINEKNRTHWMDAFKFSVINRNLTFMDNQQMRLIIMELNFSLSNKWRGPTLGRLDEPGLFLLPSINTPNAELNLDCPNLRTVHVFQNQPEMEIKKFDNLAS